jgi:hypothetical protein
VNHNNRKQMKKIFNNGWWYALITFVVPMILTLALALIKDSSVAQGLSLLFAIPAGINIMFGPSIQAYWRGNVSFRGILILNIIAIILSAGTGHVAFPGWGVWLRTWLGKVKEVSPTPLPEPIERLPA